MPIQDIEKFIKSGTMQPASDATRIRAIKSNRRLLDSNFASLGVKTIQDTESGASWSNSVNLFRQARDFYADFLFGVQPDIATDNPRLQIVVDAIKSNLLTASRNGTKNVFAFGQGVIATHPMDALNFVSWSPDLHFDVVDKKGVIVADVLLRLRDDITSTDDSEIDVFIYRIDGKNTWKVYGYNAGRIGSYRRNCPIPQTTGRQVIPMSLDTDNHALLDDMKSGVGEISRILTNLSLTLQRNSNPHMSGPSGALTINDDGQAELDESGMYIPVEEGERNPEYIVWDPGISALSWAYKQSERNALTAVGLSDAIFDPATFTGTLSGSALRRILLPFVSKLETIANVNDDALIAMLDLHNRNRATLGAEVFDFDDIDITWHHDSLFNDLDAQNETNGQPNRLDREASRGN